MCSHLSPKGNVTVINGNSITSQYKSMVTKIMVLL